VDDVVPHHTPNCVLKSAGIQRMQWSSRDTARPGSHIDPPETTPLWGHSTRHFWLVGPSPAPLAISALPFVAVGCPPPFPNGAWPHPPVLSGPEIPPLAVSFSPLASPIDAAPRLLAPNFAGGDPVGSCSISRRPDLARDCSLIQSDEMFVGRLLGELVHDLLGDYLSV
jgi:hypothetical protein